MTRSTSLCLYFKSGFLSPCHFSGNGFNDLDISVTSVARTEISPVLVLNEVPVTLKKSPISNVLASLKASSPTASNLIYT